MDGAKMMTTMEDSLADAFDVASVEACDTAKNTIAFLLAKAYDDTIAIICWKSLPCK